MLRLKRPRAESGSTAESTQDFQQTGLDDDASADEYPPWSGFDGSDKTGDAPADDAMLQDDDTQTLPVQDTTQSTRPLSLMDDVCGTREDSSEVDSPPPQRYGTRPANVDRRPGKDVGLNWKADKLEREAAEAAQSQKKSEAAAKKQDKSQRAAQEEAGVQRIAALGTARMRADREDRAQVDKRTARAYRAPLANAESVNSSGDSNNDSGGRHQNDASPALDTADSRTGGKVPSAVKQSAAEKRREQQTMVRERIVDARPDLAGKAHTHGDLYLSTPQSSAPPRKPTSDVDVFRPDYRQKLLNAASSGSASPVPRSNRATSAKEASPVTRLRLVGAAPLTPSPSVCALSCSSSHAPSLTPTPSITLHTQSTEPQRGRAAHYNAEYDDANGGFDDEDVFADAAIAVSRRSARYPEMVEVSAVEDDAETKVKKKISRTLKADMDVTQSLSAEVALPNWLNAVFEASIMPTLIDHYGGQRDPWKMDIPQGKMGTSLIDLVQELVDNLCPRRKYIVGKTSPIAKIARQRMGNWRRGFLTRANTVTATEFERIRELNPKSTRDAVCIWAAAATDALKGEAYWEHPATGQERKGHGAIQSRYILTVFAPHLQMISSSILEEHPRPVGALALACTAIEIVFKSYTTGSFKAPKEQFNEMNGGSKTDEWCTDSVEPLAEKADAFDRLMRKTRALAEKSSVIVSTQPASKCPRRVVDSSPIRSD
ncbi:hypothetical protein TRAPUB_5691 [Trametes pubescens]|uniref:DUF6532 domain-containing protein n=1 Tax=Trametes pubescens TaxID=154538 RepID=A0A1M2V7Y5_TRAPU|nr:hypothetical protein TRAPUB_5691 [Trametes pubescens]